MIEALKVQIKKILLRVEDRRAGIHSWKLEIQQSEQAIAHANGRIASIEQEIGQLCENVKAHRQALLKLESDNAGVVETPSDPS